MHRRGSKWCGGECPFCGYETMDLLVRSDGTLLLGCPLCPDRRDEFEAMLREAGVPDGAVSDQDKAQRLEEEEEQKRRSTEWARQLWVASGPVVGTPAECYLNMRRLPHLVRRRDLRYHPACWHKYERAKLPALIAKVIGANGNPVAVHRTWLQCDGSGKADIEEPRMSLGPVKGGAVRLDPAATEMVVAEGIETSASTGLLMKLPAWSAVSASNLKNGLILPDEVRSILIATDRDSAGEKAARAAERRWKAEGRIVRLLWPRKAGVDFNDILMARESAR